MSKRTKLTVSTVPEHGMKTDDFALAQVAASRVFGRQGDAPVIFEGNDAYVREDGAIVYPALNADQQMSKDEVLVARGFADHETAHKRYTDTALTKEFNRHCKASENPLLRGVGNAVDDLRVERLAVRDYSGAQTNLEATSEAVLQEFLEFANENPEQAADLDVTLPLMITAEGRKRLGYSCDSLDQALSYVQDKDREQLKAYVDLAMQAKDSRMVEGTKESHDLAKIIIRKKDEHEEDEPESRPGEGTGGGSGSSGSSGSSSAPDSGKEDDSKHTEESTGSEEMHGDPEHTQPKRVKPLDDDELKSDVLKHVFDQHITQDDNLYRPYSTQYDWFSRVGDDTPMGMGWMKDHASVAHYEDIARGMHGKISTMARKLERALLSTQRRDWQTNTEFGGLDPKRLVQASMAKPNVFRMREDRKEIDTAVSVLIDLSGSMRGRKAPLAEQVAIALSVVMEKVGVAYEVLGFNNYFMGYGGRSECKPGHSSEEAVSGKFWDKLENLDPYTEKFSRLEPLQMYSFKDFDKRLVQERAGMSVISKCSGGHNSDPDGIKYAANRLKHRPEQRKILFVLSDGMPECTCTFGRNHLFKHTKQAVTDLTKLGIECVGIGITSDAVSRFYPQYVVVHNLEDLPKQAFDQMAKLLVGDRFKVDNSELLKRA